MIKFKVDGVAKPKGSWSIVRTKKGRMFLRPSSKDEPTWSKTVATAARSAFGGEPLTTPIKLVIEVYFSRPKSHFKPSGVLKAQVPAKPITRPDADKLLRSVKDALTGIVYNDDSQVTTATISKRYGMIPCAIIRVLEDKS